MPYGDVSLFLAGDAMITVPWSGVDDPQFGRLVEEIRAADCAIVNLETVIHEFRGHAQADSGGTYMASPPEIAAELKWAGVDMVSHANNHAFDYGSTGILETLEHVKAAGLVAAGTGKDLQEARAPAMFVVDGATVALVSMASTFVPYGRASRSRPDMRGRPGLNPLELTRQTVVELGPALGGALRVIAAPFGNLRRRVREPAFSVGRIRLRRSDATRIATGKRIVPADRTGNLDAVADAAGMAGIVVAAVHSHFAGRWLRPFAHDLISRGASVVVVHGPHEMRGIELHHGRPIFYGMGDFVYQVDRITRHPAESYEKFGLGDEATAADLVNATRPISHSSRRAAFEAYAPLLSYAGGKVARIRLVPVDLQFDAPDDIRGRPRWADPRLGGKIVKRVARLSRRYGTTIRYDSERGEGTVEIA